MAALHFLENLESEVGLARMNVGANGGVQEGFGRFRKAENREVEIVVAVTSNVAEKK